MRYICQFIMVLVSATMLTACGFSFSLTKDKKDSPSTTPPPAASTFAVTLSSAATSPHAPSVISVTVDFGSVAVTGLTAGDFVVVNGSASNLVDAGGGTSFTLDLTPSGSGSYTTTIRLPAATAKNSSNEDNAASNTLSFNIDAAGPTISVATPSPTNGTSATSFVFNVTYTDATTVNLTNGSITLGGTGTTGCGAVVTNGTTTTPTVTVSGCVGDGTLNISIIANTAQDAFGNQAAAYGPSSNASVLNSFVISMKTDNIEGGSSAANVATIPLVNWIGYDFYVNWGDGTAAERVNVAGAGGDRLVTHTYASAGTYDVKLYGSNLPFIQFCNAGNADKLKAIDVKQWGTNAWWRVQFMFANCKNLDMTALDAPNLTSLQQGGGSEGFRGMFQNAEKFNGSIGGWTTTRVLDMSNMFAGAKAFNKPIGGWDTSNVTTMENMFSNAFAFNQNINGWDTSNVTSMSIMFLEAKAFNSPLNSWDVSSVTDMSGMFESTEAFNQDISAWVFSGGLNNMDQMFLNALVYNQDLTAWNTKLPAGLNPTLFATGADNWDLAKRPTFPP